MGARLPAFGEEITPDGTHRTANLKYNFGDNVRQKFTGYQKDEETQPDFAEARMYQNLHGRFTAVDPLLASGKSANPQTFNRYVYVLNNPLVLVDPDGLQVATESGRVFRKGTEFTIFENDRPADGYDPVTRTINTTTTIRGVVHHWQIRPNGWTVGGRVDGAVAAPTAPPLVRGTASGDGRVSALTRGLNQGIDDIQSGSAKGVGNFFIDAWNAGTDMTVNSRGGVYFSGGSNPFAIARYPVFSATEARWSIGIQVGITLSPLAASTPFAASGSLSVVPETQIFRFSQTNASGTFSKGGNFLGRPVLDVAGDLRSGTLSPSQVPVDYVQRGSFNLIDNTRSSIALQEAGIPMNQWNLVNRTGNLRVENAVTTKLANNGLTNTGTNTVRFNGCLYRCQ